MQKFSSIFGGIIALVLLLLYTSTIGYVTFVVFLSGQADPNRTIEHSNGLIFVMTTIGGLVSALVVAKLAATDPGGTPSMNNGNTASATGPSTFQTGIAVSYISLWLLVGLAALVVGVILFPKVSKPLSDVGTTWLGLAITAGYAYFGITPSKLNPERKVVD